MDIIIISEFCEDFSKTDNDRFLYLAKMLANVSNDNEIEIVTSSFQHTKKKHRREPREQWPFKITFIMEPGYPKNVCLKRFFSHYIWGKNVLNYIRNREKKPDVIYCAVPSLTGPNLVAKYCEKEHIRFIIDIQDLWPEAFQMAFNMPVISNIIYTPLTALANGVYKRANAICAVSDTYCQRAKAVNKKAKETVTVYLGTEIETFDKCSKAKIKIEEEEILLGYAGTLGTSYDLPLVFDALKIVNNTNLKFIIMGDGPLKNKFVQLSKGLNVFFTGRLPYDQMCGILKACDMVVNPIVSASVATIINKHADYAACGKPVLNTQRSEEYKRLVEEYQMGFNCENEEELAERISELIKNVDLRRTMGNNARRCAEERFDRKTNYTKIVKQITDYHINERYK